MEQIREYNFKESFGLEISIWKDEDRDLYRVGICDHNESNFECTNDEFGNEVEALDWILHYVECLSNSNQKRK